MLCYLFFDSLMGIGLSNLDVEPATVFAAAAASASVSSILTSALPRFKMSVITHVKDPKSSLGQPRSIVTSTSSKSCHQILRCVVKLNSKSSM